ncbi:MAG: tetratricopeptide repeat protein [Gammaproteobacteria bacterium]|nr:tetratricopeptide repeat protein [Gammaproteobacteria bacterium]
MQRSILKAPGSTNPSQQQVQHVMQLYTEDNLPQAVVQVDRLLRSFPNSTFLHNILGATHVGLGQFDAAIESYNNALKINPNDAKTHFNIGIAFGHKGDLGSAIRSYKQAINIDPNYAIAFNNMGNALKDKGDLVQAIDSYKQAIKIEPDFAEVYDNLGNAQKDSGDLELALGSYKQALQINPDYAEAYNNMGSALQDKGDLEQARNSYEQALRIKPDYTAAAWNMVGTTKHICDAEVWVERCLATDQNDLNAKIQFCVLKFFGGDRKVFNDMMQSSLKDHPTMRSLEWISKLPSLPKLHFNRWAFFDSIIELSRQDRPFYEFGVFRGGAFKYLINTFKKGFGFDTFEGLPADWHEEKAGSYSSRGNIPKIAGGEFIVGKFEDTLPVFFAQPRPMASVINFDADLYSSTICALNNSKLIIDCHTILIFDEFIINEHWEQDEYKALIEFCAANDYTFEVLAVSFFTKQVAIKLVSI